MAYAIKPLDRTTWPEFARLVERHNGVWGGCWCMGFHREGVGQDEPVRDVEAWAVVAVSRMAVDVLRSARVRRQRYVGPWLPEPVVASPGQTAADPADQVRLDDEVSYALLVVMETLSPAERTGFVLRPPAG